MMMFAMKNRYYCLAGTDTLLESAPRKQVSMSLRKSRCGWNLAAKSLGPALEKSSLPWRTWLKGLEVRRKSTEITWKRISASRLASSPKISGLERNCMISCT